MKTLVSVYIPKTGEVDTNGWLIINGEVELLSATDQSLEVLSAWPTGLWFGDEQLFCYTERQITARANTPCIAAIFRAEHFQVKEKILLLTSLKKVERYWT